MSRTRIRQSAPCAGDCAVRTLVISQHDAVLQQLVMYLSRSPVLAVTGAAFSPAGIADAHPDVLVLDLSRLGLADLRIPQSREPSLLVIRQSGDVVAHRLDKQQLRQLQQNNKQAAFTETTKSTDNRNFDQRQNE